MMTNAEAKRPVRKVGTWCLVLRVVAEKDAVMRYDEKTPRRSVIPTTMSSLSG